MIKGMTRVVAFIILGSSGYLVLLATRSRYMFTVLGIALIFAGVLQLVAVISDEVHRDDTTGSKHQPVP